MNDSNNETDLPEAAEYDSDSDGPAQVCTLAIRKRKGNLNFTRVVGPCKIMQHLFNEYCQITNK
jgi:hypothetical protein